MGMEQPNRTCTGECKKYRVKKPATGSRYGAGHARCQICDVWIDYRGGHLKDHSPATADSSGWFCICCNYKVRRSPRNIEYKAKIRSTAHVKGARREGIDLEYFNKRRARMLRGLGEAAARSASGEGALEAMLPPGMTSDEIAAEFEADIGELVALAASDSPNKASLIADLEAVKHDIGAVPTKEEMAGRSRFSIKQYEAEFQSWEHLLDRLDYDPWYRDRGRRESLDRTNMLITEALAMLKQGSSYSSELRERLGITGDEMEKLEHRLARIEGVSCRKSRRGGSADVLIKYDG